MPSRALASPTYRWTRGPSTSWCRRPRSGSCCRRARGSWRHATRRGARAGGRGPTEGKIFRIGHMGYAAETDVIIALAALEQVLADLGQPVDFGASVRAAQKVFVEKS